MNEINIFENITSSTAASIPLKKSKFWNLEKLANDAEKLRDIEDSKQENMWPITISNY